ncbi:peptidoglycan-binding domain-containing protein [Mesorhizobium sp. ANAO-SY3R2]
MDRPTRAAISEFQALFGLPVTGEPDDAMFTKMLEIGLIGQMLNNAQHSP